MNTYELTLLFAENNDTERERVLKLIADFVKKQKGEINKAESWGAKHTAYPINKQGVFVYEHFLLSLSPDSQVELNRVLKLDESIVRYLFVRV
ncbi:MAG: 30S ribosomal protein S6 [Candidatus Moraniibacteriota bacterium]|nr:MAG: 30S ribosomal protein S6 [Candidatus Moranbacteria bacterium]